MMDPPPDVLQPEVEDNVTEPEPISLPVASIKTEINEEESRGNSNSANNNAIDGLEEVTPSPTTGDEQPLNPWLHVKCILCHLNLSVSDEPKLLECLHAACGNCITSKVNDNLQGNPDLLGEHRISYVALL